MKNLAVIFDMDGVIAHTTPFHTKAFEVFFERHQIPCSDYEFETQIVGKHNSHIFSYFFKRPIRGAELLQLEDEKEGLFREIYQDQVEPLPYLLEFLADLKQADFRLAVATSAPLANMDLILDTLAIRPFFQSTLGSENVSLHKPHPEVYLKSAENLQVAPQDCIVFEDSSSGIHAGLNAGMTVVGVLSSHKAAELPKCAGYIHDYSEINSQKILNLLG